jgi:signal transduction histidine kinase
LAQSVVLVDMKLHILFANRAAESLLGVPLERLRGQSIGALIPEANLGTVLRAASRAPRVIETSAPAQDRLEGPRTLKITVSQVNDAGRNGLLVLENISGRAVLEQLLVETEKQAAMGQLAAGILHEIANPLTSLGSNLLFLRGALTSTDVDLVQALDVSLEQLDQMRQLLNTLSGFPGRPAPKYELADVQEVVRRCLVFVAKDAERRRIRLAVSLADAGIACEIDVRLIKQVLLNLLKNAMEAMPDGGRLEVSITVRASKDRQPPAIVVQIADSGVGITESDLRKVFRPLFSTKPRGAGLGLSFCRQAVEEHGGEIRLVSRGKGEGTLAVVSLPIQQPVDTDD